MSPKTSAWLTSDEVALSALSIGCGATFLPLAVTMRSFLRSVMRRKPSSMTPMSPVWNQPSGSTDSAVAAGLL